MNELSELTILLVEDEDELRRKTATFLGLSCKEVFTAANGREALESMAVRLPDLVLSDIRMPVMDGLALATRLRIEAPTLPIVFCTAFTETDYLLKAIELGVAGFVRKPVDGAELLRTLARAALPVIQERRLTGLTENTVATLTAHLWGTPVMRRVASQSVQAAATPFAVLLHGETGSGKSHLAALIHDLSPWRNGPFVSVNLGALPEQLAESELFGHVRGAFTGADRTTAGLVTTAEGGTLFLDDIDTVPLGLQAKLLRFVEEKSFIPVGETAPRCVECRIITATNRDLHELADRREFRADLYYRLADLVITLPPLRENREAIEPLVRSFLRQTGDELGRTVPILEQSALVALMALPWQGNIRELKSIVRRLAITAGPAIDAATVASVAMSSTLSPVDTVPVGVEFPPPPFPCTLVEVEKWLFTRALAHCDGARMKCARMLDLNYNTFRAALKRLGI
jgi:DNA-binding NtrC family response regulator